MAERKVLNQGEVVKEIVNRLEGNLTKADVERVFSALQDVVMEFYQKGYDVVIPKLGKIKHLEMKGRKGYNPRTKEKIEIPPKVVPKCELKKSIKEKLTKKLT